MTLLALLACACPSFEETRVRTTTTEMSPNYAVNQAADGLAFFASWTAREGVCVDEIVVEDEVTVIRDGEPRTVAGAWRSDPQRVQVASGSDIPWVTIHELCHALDDAEALVPEAAHLLDPVSLHLDPVLYPTHADRMAEAFAEMCEAGPEGLVVQEAVSEACGVDLVGDRARFLRDVVYPGFPQVGEAEPGEPIDPLEWRTGFAAPNIAGRQSLYEGGDDGGFVLVELSYNHDTYVHELRTRRYGVDTAAFLDSTPLDLGDEVTAWQAWASLVPTDTGRAWVMVSNERNVLVDPDEGVVLSFPWGALSATGFVAGGVFYAAAQDIPADIAAWDTTTGARLADVPGPDALGGAAIEHVFALPDGIGVLAGDRLARLSAGAWTVSPPLEGLSWPVIVHDGAPLLRARLNGGWEWQPVRLDADWTTWTVEPVCEETLGAGDRMVTAAGRTFLTRQDLAPERLVTEIGPRD